MNICTRCKEPIDGVPIILRDNRLNILGIAHNFCSKIPMSIRLDKIENYTPCSECKLPLPKEVAEFGKAIGATKIMCKKCTDNLETFRDLSENDE